MRNPLLISISMLALVSAAACSRSSLPDDLKQDLAKVGGNDMQLVGASSPRLDVVSAGERTQGPTPTPRALALSRTPSAFHGKHASVEGVKQDTPAPAQPARAEEVLPATAPQAERAPESVPAAAGRPEPPRPSTQREPRGGWSTPGQVIRNAPFPINP